MFVFCESPIRITEKDAFKHLENPYYLVPCGTCILCRLKARKEWTLRLRLEASLYAENCFVTLTYEDKFLPPELQVRDLQLFIKRLRECSKLKFRYYSVAEYGSRTERPHFHIIFFGMTLKDAKSYIPSCWEYGFKYFSPLSKERCNYACGYTQKKYDKKLDKSLFQLFPHLSYEERLSLFLNCGDMLEEQYHMNITPRRAEFATCSLGIGKRYLDKYYEMITEQFYINFGGKNYSIPRYFRKKIAERDPDWNELWKGYMQEYAKKNLEKLFDKVSLEFLDEDLSSCELEIEPGIKVSLDYDQFLMDKWKEYVDFRALNIKKKRELFKNKKKNFMEC